MQDCFTQTKPAIKVSNHVDSDEGRCQMTERDRAPVHHITSHHLLQQPHCCETSSRQTASKHRCRGRSEITGIATATDWRSCHIKQHASNSQVLLDLQCIQWVYTQTSQATSVCHDCMYVVYRSINYDHIHKTKIIRIDTAQRSIPI